MSSSPEKNMTQQMTKLTPTFSFQILANVFKVQVKNLR
jgi:hypothetical protein